MQKTQMNNVSANIRREDDATHLRAGSVDQPNKARQQSNIPQKNCIKRSSDSCLLGSLWGWSLQPPRKARTGSM